ncbi:MAG: DUF6714 family protein [Gammaproteobacteria bacterium]
MDIEEMIHNAFSGTQLAPGELFVTSRTEGAEQVFPGAQWTQLNAETLKDHSASINFLSNEAFAYFLPAFMIAALEDSGIAVSLIYKLTPPKNNPSRPSFAAWWVRLSREQQITTISFLEHLEAQGDTIPPGVLDILRAELRAKQSPHSDT